ncbi:MAG: hypothetical protein IKL96_06790 [Kiritimatiellae bacterium]|nr:hypothetical protein [Kiritimatiellia bacterium]
MIVVHFKTLLTPLRANILLFGLLAAATHAAVPVAWTNSPGMPPYPIKPVPHGVPVDFRVTLRGYSSPPAAPGADVRLWFQTNGMGSAWWSAPATLEGDVITATFGAEQDTGADRVALFFGAPLNVFASAILRLTHSPGFAPNVRPPPVARLDFSALEVLNAPYYTQAETDARIVALAPTPGDYANVSNRAMSALQPSALSSANPAFAAAVTNCPVVIAADADIAEYGTYGTVAAALAALAAGLAALKRGKVDKVTGSGITGYLPVLKSDGGLQRSYYVPTSFAQAYHGHSATDIYYNGYAAEYAGRYLWEAVDDLAGRVAALEQGTELDSVTLGTVHCDGMSVTAYPHVVGCTSDQYPSPSPDSCMTCLMAPADFLLDPNDSMSGDFSYGGQLKPELYGFGYEIGAGFASSHQCRSFDVEFVMDLDSSTFCGGVTPLGAGDFYSFRATDYLYPASALVQDAEGAWWVCFAPDVGTYGRSNPVPSMPDPHNPQYLAWELQDEWAGSCEDPHEAVVHVFVRDSAGCGGDYYDCDASVSLCYAPPVGGGCC